MSNNFDILLPVYAGDEYIKFKKALLSVLENDLQPNKIFILRDGPVSEQLQKYIQNIENKYEHIRVISYSKNRGLTAVLNDGLSLSSSKYVIRCDADDINKKNRFRIIFSLIQNSDISLIGSAVEEYSEIGSNRELIGVRDFSNNNARIAQAMFFRNQFNHMSVIFNRKIAIKLGGYPDLKYREDYGLWLKFIAKKYKCLNISNKLVEVSAGNDQLARRSGFQHFLPEIKLTILKCRLFPQNMIAIIFYGLIRIFFLLSPVKLRLFIGK